MKKTFLVLILFSAAILCPAREITLKIDGKYLNIPVSHGSPRVDILFETEGTDPIPVPILLAEGEADYWVFRDLTDLKGKKLRISTESDDVPIERMFIADTIVEQSEIYREKNRPQYHFTSRRGWLNDPNGLIFADGLFHLYYQHNPYDRDGSVKHWGHAVSDDLVHWRELPTAIYPDKTGPIWSGTTVIDPANTSGFGKGGNAPMVAAYTVDLPDREIQCLAYSNDGGRTFTKYAGNPVIDSHDRWNTRDTRDPKLLRYGDHWVMVLAERDGNSFYTSPNLRDWTYRSHITGFWECPDLFELPVDNNPDSTLWVMYGASGTYMLGHFDGEAFTPVSGKHKYVGGSFYAGQTFNDVPATDGRRIQIAWGRIGGPEPSFSQMMLLPTELSLVRDSGIAGGVRLVSRPVAEIDRICRRLGQWHDVGNGECAGILDRCFRQTDGLMRIRATLTLTHATDAAIILNGQRLVDYDLNGTTLNGYHYSPADPTSMSIDVDIFIDRTSVEVFADNGRFSYSFGRNITDSPARFKIAGAVKVDSLEVFGVSPIWGTEGVADTYTNPVLRTNFPDPTVIRGGDGMFYAYATQGRLGDIPIFKSSDLVDWEYVGTAFPAGDARPDLLPGGNLWAPDIMKVGDRYVLVYSQSRWGEEHLNGLGIATADRPEGPFSDAGKLFTSDEIGVQNSIDPSFFMTDDGRLLLLWGSFSGLYMLEMDPATLKPVPGAAKRFVAGTAFEGSHIYKHDGKYYLFASVGTCCEGDRSTYRVVVGRGDTPTGPFFNREGLPMTDNHYTEVISGDDVCRGPGHGSQIITDRDGDTWYLFHGYEAGKSRDGRQMWLERILWDEQGWPYVANGHPSHTPTPKPKF